MKLVLLLIFLHLFLQEAYCEYLRTINYISYALLEEAASQSKTLAVTYITNVEATLTCYVVIFCSVCLLHDKPSKPIVIDFLIKELMDILEQCELHEGWRLKLGLLNFVDGGCFEPRQAQNVQASLE